MLNWRPMPPQDLRFVALATGVRPLGAFRAVVGETRLDAAAGGCELVERIATPDGTRFIVLRFHGDVAWWQGLVEANAARQGLVTAWIERDALVLSDGREFWLEDCAVEPGA